MIKTITITLIVAFLLQFWGCKNKVNTDGSIYFTNKSFDKKYSLTGQILKVPLSGKPLSYTLIRDSVLLVNYWESDTFLIDLVNINTGLKIKSIARKGKGPEEFLNATVKYKSLNDQYFSIHDVVKQIITRYDIDSLLIYNNYTGASYKIPSFAQDFAFFRNDSILLYNSNYLIVDKGPLNKNAISPIYCVKKSESTDSTCRMLDSVLKPKYFASNVSNGNLLISPDKENIWLIDSYSDEISVYNSSFNLVKRYRGPGELSPRYEIRPDSAVYFRDGKYYRSFYPSFATENFIYLLYVGVDGIDLNFSKVERPVSVLKIDWGGNLVALYTIKNYLYNISISSDEKYLYGTTVKSFGDSARLIRYILK